MGGNSRIIHNGSTIIPYRYSTQEHGTEQLKNSVIEFITAFNQLGIAGEIFTSGSTDFIFQDILRTYGDLDFQLNEDYSATLEQHLVEGLSLGDFTFIASKKSPKQLITVWKYTPLNKPIQIDFEFVEYINEKPTEWSKFSHSSSINDFALGIKGVYHKFLIRAITATHVSNIVLACDGRTITDNLLAFSVIRGLRYKYTKTPYGYSLLKPAESTYITDVDEIFEILIPFYERGDPRVWSFEGLCSMIAQYFSTEDQFKIVRGFFRVLGQQPTDSDPDIDMKNKMAAIEHLMESLS